MIYDRSVSDQEKALDDMLTKSQDAAESYLKDSEKVFIDALSYVNANTSQVSQNLEKISKDLGFDISTYITNAWKDGGDAVGTYESKLRLLKVTHQKKRENAYNSLNPIFRMLKKSKQILYMTALFPTRKKLLTICSLKVKMPQSRI